jgi:hypothetical protein
MLGTQPACVSVQESASHEVHLMWTMGCALPPWCTITLGAVSHNSSHAARSCSLACPAHIQMTTSCQQAPHEG